MQLDDLITKENSKLKPLSVSLLVDEKTRFILGSLVSEIPAFGHLAKQSVQVYEKRKDEHRAGPERLLSTLNPFLSEELKIKSDEHKNYPVVIQRYFPRARHETFPSERGCIAGQGELKKVAFDQLFIVNHTCALLRANINRLMRKTWCTIKDPARLSDHLEIFTYLYNNHLLKSSSTPFLSGC